MHSVPAKPFWSLHTHSKFSVNDALPEVGAIVAKAQELDYPALGLTDHGSPSGLVQLYKACRKVGIEPLPGIELYVTPDSELNIRKNLHLTMAAYTEQGYRNLMQLSSLSARRFWYKPRVDFADFAAMAEDGVTSGLVVSTGCLGGVLPQVLLNQGPKAAVAVARTLAGWFPRVYVELQNHGIEMKEFPGVTDDDVLDGLWDVAQEAGLPVILARDSHYVNEEDRELHESLKTLVSWNQDDPDDAIFSGEGYFMTDAQGLKPFYPPKMLAAGLDGLAELAEAAYVRLPELETFSLKVPDVSIGGDSQAELEDLIFETLTEEQRKDSVIISQLRAEFDVIRAGGMAPYILLVIMVAKFMRENGIRYWVRGSAAGCLVLYLSKVSQVDPIRLGLRFDRFLSSNRMKPPDVDFDVEHQRRDEVIRWLNSLWATQSIGSHMKYSLLENENEEESSGSLRMKFYSALRKRGVEHPPAWRDVPTEDKRMLYALGDLKLVSGYGTHAAGYIVAPNQQVLDQLPLAYIASSKKLVTAYGKKDVEQLGFLKLDLLGLRTATAVRLMEESSSLAFDDIPEDDVQTFRNIAAGKNDGVFQLDGWTMTKGCKELKPTKIGDLIAAQALYRPATINSGAKADYIARRFKRQAVPVRHEIIMESTKETFGVLLYQEQVMDVMQGLGMTPVELEEMLDAVKASNEYSLGAAEVIKDKMPHIRELALDKGWTGIDIDWLVDGLGAYADYSFNKAHAASYGYVAYRTAFMKTHHTLDFWTAMLISYADHDKHKQFTTSARRDGLRIMPAHVNRSKVTYSMERELNAIRKGLLSIKGIGSVAAHELAEKAPYESLVDLGQRVLPRRVTGAGNLVLRKSPAESGGTIAALDEANALEDLEVDGESERSIA